MSAPATTSFAHCRKIHCSLMHTYVNSFSQCLVSSINLTSSVKICVWSRSSWKFRLANNRWSKTANVFSMPFNSKRRQCADKLGSAGKLQTNFYDSKNERRQCADKLGFCLHIVCASKVCHAHCLLTVPCAHETHLLPYLGYRPVSKLDQHIYKSAAFKFRFRCSRTSYG